jgi:hypothetical protein
MSEASVYAPLQVATEKHVLKEQEFTALQCRVFPPFGNSLERQDKPGSASGVGAISTPPGLADSKSQPLRHD